MPSRIVIIQGHPDATRAHFCHALADHYAGGALAGGHAVRRIEVASLCLPLLTTPGEWENDAPSDTVSGLPAGHRVGPAPRDRLSALARGDAGTA